MPAIFSGDRQNLEPIPANTDLVASERSIFMLDAVLLAAGLAYFAAMILYTRVCERF